MDGERGDQVAVGVNVETGVSTDATYANAAADVSVAFGITGDVARVMTFRSLYRLERRGLLNCPALGMALDDWSVEHLREDARAWTSCCTCVSPTRCSSWSETAEHVSSQTPHSCVPTRPGPGVRGRPSSCSATSAAGTIHG
ncbi:MAG: hypothetical protein ACLP8S_31525 [Solirubrobacteraceae bacterium]